MLNFKQTKHVRYVYYNMCKPHVSKTCHCGVHHLGDRG